MSAFDSYSWYILSSAADSINNTLTAANNTQVAFDPDSPSALFYAPVAQPVRDAQLWQLYPITSSTSSAYIFRNRALGPNAYLTTAWTTRKCGGGKCATVPVLSPDLNDQSLWNFGAWGFSDEIGGAFVYNFGNGSDWRLDQALESDSQPEIQDYLDTNRRGSHWTVNLHATFASNEASGFSDIPAAASTLLAQVTNTGSVGSVSPYTAVVTGPGAGTSPSSPDATGGSQSSGDVDDSPLSIGAAVGVGVGLGVFCLLVILGILFLIFRHRKKKARQHEASEGMIQEYDDEYHGAYGPDDMSLAHGPGRNRAHAEMDTPFQHTNSRTAMITSEMSHPSERIRAEVDGRSYVSPKYELSASPTVQAVRMPWSSNASTTAASQSQWSSNASTTAASQSQWSNNGNTQTPSHGPWTSGKASTSGASR